MSRSERQELILKKMKEKGIEVGSGIPGKKYDSKGQIRPQEKDWATSDKAKSAKIFKDARRRVVDDPKYIHMRKEWRRRENANL